MEQAIELFGKLEIRQSRKPTSEISEETGNASKFEPQFPALVTFHVLL